MLLLALLACTATTGSNTPAGDPVRLVDYVDPFIGTGGIGYSVGSAYPGAATPFGLVKVSPDTADVYGSAPEYYHGGGYHYDDGYIQAFSHMHMDGIGVSDYGAVGVMAVDRGDPDAPLAAEQTLELGYQAPFSHDDEAARPGWYQVHLGDRDVTVTLAATRHTALHRYVFGQVAAPTLLIDLGHVLFDGRSRGGWVEVDPKTGTVTGQMVVDGGLSAPFSVWFVATPEPIPSRYGTWSGDEGKTWGDASNIVMNDGGTTASYPIQGDEIEDAAMARYGAWLGFPPDVGTVNLRVALSTVDMDGAWTNLQAEADTWDVDAVADDAWADWDTALSALRVWGGTNDDRTKLATALYHTLQMPTIFSDVDGRYTGFDKTIHTSDHVYHTDYSLWDTYRTTHPLYTLLWPDWHREILASLADMAQQGGNLPRWAAATGDAESMLGTPANIVWAEAWRKGLRGWGEDTVLPIAMAVALGQTEPAYGGRPDVSLLDTFGYTPADEQGSSVAWTQECAISDYALAEAASGMGWPDDAATLRKRGDAWSRLYNPDTGWIQGRYQDGTFVELGDPGVWDDMYAEGNARQYLWLAPQDPEALFDLLGGDDVALARLTEMMEQTAAEEDDRLEAIPNSWYWHGNEPSFHIPWLFGLAGRPDQTREWVRWIMDTYYGTGPDGLTGNDDAGANSAWYVFAAMGIYPLAGTQRYVLGLPAFSQIQWDMDGPDGKAPFTISSDVNPFDGLAAVDITLNGVDWPSPFLSHDYLKPGGSLHFGLAQ